MEIWKQSCFKNYEVSSFGNVRNKRNGKLLHPSIGTHGYYSVACGKGHTRTIHRLEAIAFIPNPDNLEQVNHKDGNKLNNNVENLEWLSRADNARHSFKLGLSYQTKCVKIQAVVNNTVQLFNSIFEAANKLQIRRASIQDYLTRKRLTPVNGYTFRKVA